MITNTDLGISVTSGYGKLRLKTAPTATPVSVAEAKTHLRIDSSFTADDTYIETLISVATFAAENYMNLWIMSHTQLTNQHQLHFVQWKRGNKKKKKR